jgi:hypothetical protein
MLFAVALRPLQTNEKPINRHSEVAVRRQYHETDTTVPRRNCAYGTRCPMFPVAQITPGFMHILDGKLNVALQLIVDTSVKQTFVIKS